MSIATAAKAAGTAVGKVTAQVRGTKVALKELLASGGWSVIHDGKLADALLLKSPSGNLLGTDDFGNQYFEDMTAQYGRNRWVLFKDMDNMSGEDPSTVPPEWHGWLHHVTDQVPTIEPFSKPRYAVECRGNPTGTGNRYGPKGSWAYGSERRNWIKHSVWSGQPSLRGKVASSA